MATANDVIRRALRLAGVIASGETPDADLASDTLSVYNALLAEWHEAEIGVPDYSVASIGATVTTDAADNEAIAHQIAVRVMAEYGLSVPPELARGTDESFARLRLRYFQPGTVDWAELPGKRTGYNIDTDA